MSGVRAQPAASLAIPTQDLLDAMSDPAVTTMPAGPAKEFLDQVFTFATSDYDHNDAIVLVVLPPTYSRSTS